MAACIIIFVIIGSINKESLVVVSEEENHKIFISQHHKMITVGMFLLSYVSNSTLFLCIVWSIYINKARCPPSPPSPVL